MLKPEPLPTIKLEGGDRAKSSLQTLAASPGLSLAPNFSLSLPDSWSVLRSQPMQSCLRRKWKVLAVIFGRTER